MRPAKLAPFRWHPAIPGPPIRDQAASKCLAQQFLCHLAAAAAADEENRDGLSYGGPQPGAMIGFPPSGLVEVHHRLLLDKAAGLGNRFLQDFTSGTLQCTDRSQCQLYAPAVRQQLLDVA